jgi:hypothetical protein
MTRKNMMKWMVYAHMAARAVGQEKKKKEGDGVGATSKYCAIAIEDDENGSSERRQGGPGGERRRKAMMIM